MSTISTVEAASGWAADQYTFAPADLIPDALILQTSTVAGAVDGDDPAVRVAYVKDDPNAANFIAEAAPITEGDPDLDEVVLHTRKISVLIKVSNEQFGQPQTAAQLAASAARSIVRKADSAYLAQAAPTPPAVAPATGLWNVDDLIEGDPVDGSLDALVDLLAAIEAAEGHPSHILLDPVGWATLRKIRTGEDYNSTLLGSGTHDSPRMLLSLPVIVNAAMPALSGLVVDKSAVVSAVGQIRAANSQHEEFSSDVTTIRVTWRTAHGVMRPERLGKFTIGDPSS